jgi:K+-sensing histidine kinase KdpD
MPAFSDSPPPRDPWFRRRPRAALTIAALLFAAVLVLRMFVGDAADAYSMLYVLPVALVATAFGLRAGIAAGMVGVALVAVWVLADDVSLSPTGWLSRAVPILLLGIVLGDATDRLRRAEEQRQRLEASALLHREAIEINDSLVQGMAAAKWSLESGQTDLGIQTLETTISQAQDLVSGLIRRADMGGRAEDVHPHAP